MYSCVAWGSVIIVYEKSHQNLYTIIGKRFEIKSRRRYICDWVILFSFNFYNFHCEKIPWYLKLHIPKDMRLKFYLCTLQLFYFAYALNKTKQLFEHNFQCSWTVNRMRNDGNYLYTLTSLNQYVASIKPGAPCKMPIKSY